MQQKIAKHKIIEHYLNKVDLNGIRIGSLIAQYYALNVISKQHAKPIFTNLMVIIKYLLTLWNNKKIKPIKADFIFTKLNNRFHFNALMNPLISHYRKDSIVLYDENSFNKEEIFIKEIKEGSIIFSQTNANSTKDSLKILFAILTASYLMLKNRKRLHLNYHEVIYFINNLLVQLRRSSFWDHYFALADHKPLCIVTEFDRSAEASPLVLAAKKHKIPTITLIHGVLEDYSFTPFFADYIFCWGKGQKSQLIAKNIDPQRIIITGNPMFNDITPGDNTNNQSIRQVSICLAISPGFDNSSVIKPFITALNKIENANGIIKLHPSLAKEEFNWAEMLCPRIKILGSSEIKNSDLFRKIDLLIINDSGIANEALAAGVPVSVLNPSGINHLNTYQNELIHLADCKLATNERELTTIFDEINADPLQFRVNAIKKSVEYLKNLYETTGNISVNVMITTINQISKKRSE